MKMRFTLRGQRALRLALLRVRKRAPEIFGGALFVEGERIMKESKKIVPVDTGALRSSGHVKVPVLSGSRVSVTLAYGGSAAPYAVFVHEKANARHRPPTRWKYLEEPFLAAREGMAMRIARRMRREIARAGR